MVLRRATRVTKAGGRKLQRSVKYMRSSADAKSTLREIYDSLETEKKEITEQHTEIQEILDKVNVIITDIRQISNIAGHVVAINTRINTMHDEFNKADSKKTLAERTAALHAGLMKSNQERQDIKHEEDEAIDLAKDVEKRLPDLRADLEKLKSSNTRAKAVAKVIREHLGKEAANIDAIKTAWNVDLAI